ncbi:MAG: histidine phosphatase family protein [Bacillota bacterium]
MRTFIYMVRHGDSPKEGSERTRGLTKKGQSDVQRITDVLRTEGIQTVVSSPYTRSILTVEPIARHIGKEVIVIEDLKERVFSDGDKRVTDQELMPLLNMSFKDPNFAAEGGESNADCQQRAVRVLQGLLSKYNGQKIVIGTHGAVMTLMMGFFDEQYDLEFLQSTTKPDIYRLEFNRERLVKVDRLWSTPKT